MNVAVKVPSMSRLSSPVLRAFELNPFRVLRLHVDATTSAASFQAENALTLSRVGMSLEEPDLLPWLAPADPYELQQAAQAIEEPLVRLKHQMMWFDQVRDPQSAALASALRDPPGEAWQHYMDLDAALPELPAEGELPPADHGAVAHAINQANIRLLAVAATLNGLQSGRADRVVEGRPIARSQWKELGGFRSLAQAHTVLLAEQIVMVARFDARRCWVEALKRWMHTVGHPWFISYLGGCIAALGDDFVTSDDIEAVQESIRMQLADLSMLETRHLLLEGRFEPASALIATVAEAQMEARVLMPAMQPLRQVFRSELAELEPLLEQPLDAGLEQINRYLSRLELIRNRWLTLDHNGVIGLADVLDEAAEKAYLRLRSQDKPALQTEELLARLSKAVSAQSLRERAFSYQAELKQLRERICEFCKTNDPDYEKSVVLRGKIETGRDSGFSNTTVYYTIRHAIMLRCARCASFHEFLREAGVLVSGALITASAFLLLWADFVHSVGGLLLAAGIGLFLSFFSWLGLIIQPILRYSNAALAYVSRWPFAILFTPRHHRRIGDYAGSKASRDLLDHQITVDWRSDAIAFIEKGKRGLNTAIVVPAVAFFLSMLVPELITFLQTNGFPYQVAFSLGRPIVFSPVWELPITLAIALGLWVRRFPVGLICLATISILLALAMSELFFEVFLSLLFSSNNEVFDSEAYLPIIAIRQAVAAASIVVCLAWIFAALRQFHYPVLYLVYSVAGVAFATWAWQNVHLPASSFNFLYHTMQIPAEVVLGVWMQTAAWQLKTSVSAAEEG